MAELKKDLSEQASRLMKQLNIDVAEQEKLCRETDEALLRLKGRLDTVGQLAVCVWSNCPCRR